MTSYLQVTLPFWHPPDMIPFKRSWKQADYGCGPSDIPVCPNCSSPFEVDEPWGFLSVPEHPDYETCMICSCNIFSGSFYRPTPGGFHEDDVSPQGEFEFPQRRRWVPDRRPVPCRADG